MRQNNILIVTSGRASHVMAGIDMVKERFSPEKIILLAQHGKECSAFKGGGEIFKVDGDGRFDLFKIGGETIKKINKSSIDHVVILYNNIEGINCFNLDLIAFFLKGKVWIYDVRGDLYPLASSRYFFKILLKRSAAYLFQKVMEASFIPLLILLSLLNKIFKIRRATFEKQKIFGG